MADDKQGNGLSVQLARLETKLDSTNTRLDGFNERMDRADAQRDLDRKEIVNLREAMASTTAVCALHIQRTSAAETAAATAVKDAASAREKAASVESSWNETLLRRGSLRPGSAEHMSTTRALEERARTREEEREALHKTVAEAAATAVTTAIVEQQKKDAEQVRGLFYRLVVKWGPAAIIALAGGGGAVGVIKAIAKSEASAERVEQVMKREVLKRVAPPPPQVIIVPVKKPDAGQQE